VRRERMVAVAVVLICASCLFVCGRFGISEERHSGRANEGKETENNRPSSVPKPTFIMLWKMTKTFSLQNYLGPWQAGVDAGCRPPPK
jgi:hypothetical protein